MADIDDDADGVSVWLDGAPLAIYALTQAYDGESVPMWLARTIQDALGFKVMYRGKGEWTDGTRVVTTQLLTDAEYDLTTTFLMDCNERSVWIRDLD